MESKTVKKILHAKDSHTKLVFFHNEIINRLENSHKITVVNMPEFELIKDTRITCRRIDEIATVQQDQIVFIFNAFPSETLMRVLGRLDCKEISVAVVDFSAIYVDIYVKNGFDTFYISDNYVEENPVFGSVEELNAALLRTIT